MAIFWGSPFLPPTPLPSQFRSSRVFTDFQVDSRVFGRVVANLTPSSCETAPKKDTCRWHVVGCRNLFDAHYFTVMETHFMGRKNFINCNIQKSFTTTEPHSTKTERTTQPNDIGSSSSTQIHAHHVLAETNQNGSSVVNTSNVQSWEGSTTYAFIHRPSAIGHRSIIGPLQAYGHFFRVVHIGMQQPKLKLILQ